MIHYFCSFVFFFLFICLKLYFFFQSSLPSKSLSISFKPVTHFLGSRASSEVEGRQVPDAFEAGPGSGAMTCWGERDKMTCGDEAMILFFFVPVVL